MKLPRLREVRELRGWSQGVLAEKADVSRDSISNYETGHREAYPATAKKLADTLGVEIADLVARAEEPVLAGKAEAPKAGPPQVSREDLAALGVSATDPELRELNDTMANLWHLMVRGDKARAFIGQDNVDAARVLMLLHLVLDTPSIVTPEAAGVVRQGIREQLKA